MRLAMAVCLLTATAEGLAVDAALIVQRVDPWQNQVTVRAAPDASAAIERLDVHAARNEYESAAINVFNTETETVYAYVSVTSTAGARSLPPECVTVREAVPLRAIGGSLVADALPRLEPDQVLTIPAGEVRQVWLEITTGDLRPGVHEATLRIEPLASDEPIELRLRLHVWDFTLPERLPIAVFNWDFTIAHLAEPMRSRYLHDMVEHGVNVFHITGEPRVVCDAQGNLLEEPDFSGWDELIALERRYARMFLFESWQFRGRALKASDGTELAYLSAPWVRAFQAWLRGLIEYTRGIGLEYREWAFYPFDEYIGPDFVGIAREIRRIDPQVLIFTDKLADAEQMAAAAPYADIWCPYDGHLGRPEGAASEQIMHASGRPIWFYFCGTDQKRFPPLGRYRLMGWKTWRRGFGGCTYWTIFEASGSPWDDFDSTVSDAASVYRGLDGPIPSRRWEAFREGLEDWCYLDLLRRRIDEAGEGPEVDEARRILDDAPTRVMRSADTRTIEIWRRRLAEAIVDLGRDRR